MLKAKRGRNVHKWDELREGEGSTIKKGPKTKIVDIPTEGAIQVASSVRRNH